MESTKLEEFIEFLDRAIEKGEGIRVLIGMPDLPCPEMIVNPASNVEAKRDYYRRAYNDDLQLKTFTEIEIIHYETFEVP